MIGAGTMGKVYRARQHGEAGEVAVKFLRKSFLQQPRVVRRFLGEARTVSGLHHPNIVGIRGVGRTPGGAYFLVMELVDGPNLALVGRTRAISEGEAVRWSIQACDALEHAACDGVIHCDLKPANLLLDAAGHLRVADFGLARSLTGDTPWTAEIEGTAPFMAPEQVSRSWGAIERGRTSMGSVPSSSHSSPAAPLGSAAGSRTSWPTWPAPRPSSSRPRSAPT